LAKVNVPINKKRKLGFKTVDCIFLGYAHHSIAYRFLVVKYEVPDKHVNSLFESHDATFFENIFPTKDSHVISLLPLNETVNTTPKSVEFTEHDEYTLESNHQKIYSDAPRRSKRQKTGDDFTVYLIDDSPKIITEAFSSPDADDWKEAVHSEMDSVLSNRTWELVERPYGCKPVGCKWVFKKKLKPDGTIDKYKARLRVTHRKKAKISLILTHLLQELTTIRVLLSLAASHGLLIHQMDVKTAFLNGELE
jgi:hypothetical protein